MKQKLNNIKLKFIALWWFLTHKNFYLLSYGNGTGKTLESYNVVIPEFYVWFQKKRGYMTNHDIIMVLKNGRGLLRYKDYSNLEDLFNTLISKLENE